MDLIPLRYGSPETARKMNQDRGVGNSISYWGDACSASATCDWRRNRWGCLTTRAGSIADARKLTLTFAARSSLAINIGLTPQIWGSLSPESHARLTSNTQQPTA